MSDQQTPSAQPPIGQGLLRLLDRAGAEGAMLEDHIGQISAELNAASGQLQNAHETIQGHREQTAVVYVVARVPRKGEVEPLGAYFDLVTAEEHRDRETDAQIIRADTTVV
jgi:hypothetical protein